MGFNTNTTGQFSFSNMNRDQYIDLCDRFEEQVVDKLDQMMNHLDMLDDYKTKPLNIENN
ncbi:MAG: hypothetical protein AB8G05_20750 [Oligoflexales bacterium]